MLRHSSASAALLTHPSNHYLNPRCYRAFVHAAGPCRGPATADTSAQALEWDMVTSAGPDMQQQIHKPLCDRRSYKHAILGNGLRVLAIQDKDAVFAAACANVQAGYFDDPLPGAAHFLEHMVHLGSRPFPDEKEYKAFLAAHGGSSNASTSMVHTRYHLKVHGSALPGALQRLGAALSQPLLAADSAGREVENVHAEYSRNTNSDSRKLLQLKRSLCDPPYSGFSTGSIKTLWEEPNAAGVSVPDVLRQLWQECYNAEAVTVAVVGPQETQEVLQLVQEAFGSMRSSSGSSGSSGSGCGSNGGSSGHVGQIAKAQPVLTAEQGGAVAEVDVSSSSSASSSNAGEDSGSETDTTTATAAAAAAPEAVVHAKARQGASALPVLGADADETCTEIAAHGHHHAHEHEQQGSAHGQQQQQQQQRVHLPQQQQQQQQQRYPVDVVGSAAAAAGLYVAVCPQRDLRELQVQWYIPCGACTHSSVKPWHLASHLLGHEGPGSVAHLLKAQGLVQSLSVGSGDEVRLGRGWMFWGATLQLTDLGEDHVEHVLATLMRGVQVLQSCSDSALQSAWREAAALAQLRFDWRDGQEPLAAAQAAAYALHYYRPDQVLSGPVLMMSYDVTPIRWFLNQLSPHSMRVFWSSKRHKDAASSKEPFYGAQYVAQPLPYAWLQAVQAYRAVDMQTTGSAQQQQQQQQFAPVPGELHLPAQNWAIPTDFDLRPAQNSPTGSHDSAAGHATAAAAAEGTGAAAPGCDQAVEGGHVPSAPVALISQPGLCVWHKHDTSFGLPKVHLKLYIVTPAVYTTPAVTVSSRLLVRVLDDLLLPTAYPAELAGTCYSLGTGQGGLVLKVTGFQGVAQQLMGEVLSALKGLTAADVEARFSTMQGRLTQGLRNWANNNPAQHSEYAAEHLLQQQQHHNRDLLQAAAAAAAPADVLQLQQQLISGLNMHLDMLAYGNISSSEAAEIAARVQQLLPAQGLVNPSSWPALGRVYSLSTLLGFSSSARDTETVHTVSGVGKPNAAAATAATAAGAAAAAKEGAAEGAGPVCVTFLPDNPNPSNSNHALYYCIQVGPDDVAVSVMCDLFVQMSSKAAFHELRTVQRLGYSVALSSRSLQRQLLLVLRVQSPGTAPAAIAAAVRGWCGGFRGQLLGLAQEKLDSHKQALYAKYLEPAKSLHEAAHRAWVPIGSSRTLVFDRRQQKAAAVQAVTQDQLMQWFEDYVNPEGQQHHALCVQVWGGAGPAPADAVAAAQQAGVSSSVVVPDQVSRFKQHQSLLPLPAMQLPPAAAAL